MHLSILMPAFNVERYISEAVESVLSQTHKDFEFVIIDDGSTDNTLAIAESYARKDGRVKVISHPNMGIVGSLNKALDLASNEWIVRMDADDIMLPNRIERQVSFVHENPGVAVAGTLVYYVSENGEFIGKSPRPRLAGRDSIEEFVRRNKSKGKSGLEALPTVGFPHFMVYHGTVIMRKSVVKEVGGYRQEFLLAEDFDLWNRIIEGGYIVLIQPEYLFKYRRYDSSSSTARIRLTQLRIDWVEDCTLRRRSGRSELSWEKFLAARRQAPWWKRLDQERKDLAKVLYSTARFHFTERKHYSFVPILLGAILLQPGYVLPRVLSFRYFGGRDGSSRR